MALCPGLPGYASSRRNIHPRKYITIQQHLRMKHSDKSWMLTDSLFHILLTIQKTQMRTDGLPVCSFWMQIIDNVVYRVTINNNWRPLIHADVIRSDRTAIVGRSCPWHMNACRWCWELYMRHAGRAGWWSGTLCRWAVWTSPSLIHRLHNSHIYCLPQCQNTAHNLSI